MRVPLKTDKCLAKTEKHGCAGVDRGAACQGKVMDQNKVHDAFVSETEERMRREEGVWLACCVTDVNVRGFLPRSQYIRLANHLTHLSLALCPHESLFKCLHPRCLKFLL